MDNNNLISFQPYEFKDVNLNDEELSILQIKLWRLLSRRTRLYTMSDSSSVRIETAQELLSSIYFLLNLYLKDSGIPLQNLINLDENELFTRAIKVVEEKIEHGKNLYQAAYLSAPHIENISLVDTLNSIGSAFKQYDYQYFAHQFPCEIDYQLCHAVSETIYGIEYINEYLSRLIMENSFIGYFQKEYVICLLNAYCADYKGLLINLYEPVVTNAIGLALLQAEVFDLNITSIQKSKILALLSPLSQTETLSLLRTTAEKLSTQLEIGNTAASDYLIQTAFDLYPRIKVASTVHNIDGIFLSF